MSILKKETTHSRSGTLNDDQLRDVVRQIMEGLLHLHQNNICHNDLKPSNLLVGGDGTVQIADFGVSGTGRVRQDTAGTPAFMSPEGACRAGSSRRVSSPRRLSHPWHIVFVCRSCVSSQSSQGNPMTARLRTAGPSAPRSSASSSAARPSRAQAGGSTSCAICTFRSERRHCGSRARRTGDCGI